MAAKTMEEATRLLERPFGSDDLEWRMQRAGIKNDGEIWAVLVPYITARAAQVRLDEVFGLDGWEVRYRDLPLGERLQRSKSNPGEVVRRQITGVVAQLRFRVPGSEQWVVREDGAEPTDIEAVKGGISGAFKRVVVTVGIGRYLYGTGEMWADIVDKSPHMAYVQKPGTKGRGDRIKFYWTPRPTDLLKLTNDPRPALPPTSAERSLRSQPAEPTGGVPPCPKCEGAMQDQRRQKTKTTQPDYRCKTAGCRGAVWLDSHRAVAATA